MNKHYIELQNLAYRYKTAEGEVAALKNISLRVSEGEHVAILGANGSGKSTLAKLISSLELKQEGEIEVAGIQPITEEDIWELRRICAMVFQNPDNQIIGTTVEEDIAFGPENLGIDPSRIRRRVDQCANMVGLQDFLQKAPSALSGGQKQKLAIAGVLAMEPRIIILDEATSMLDPISRTKFMDLVVDLARQYKLTIINITHHMDEALLADHIAVIADGSILFQGKPEEVFARVTLLQSVGLDISIHTAIAHRLAETQRLSLDSASVVTWEGAQKFVRSYLLDSTNAVVDNSDTLLSSTTEALAAEDSEMRASVGFSGVVAGDSVIEVEHLGHVYKDGAQTNQALHDISFTIRKGEIFGIMGHTGSGKSTLISHLNGILRAQEGQVKVMGKTLSENRGVKEVRRYVGLLFQYPEHQLFAETVAADIAFGPSKLGWTEDEVKEAILAAAHTVGLSDDLLERSPFELSGGQKRRVALAGILAMRPQVLILDEPAAALDPRGREAMLKLIKKLQSQGVTVVVVSHSMNDLARVCDRILVLEKGKMLTCATPQEIFSGKENRFTMPATVSFLQALQADFPQLNTACFSIGSAVRAIMEAKEIHHANRLG